MTVLSDGVRMIEGDAKSYVSSLLASLPCRMMTGSRRPTRRFRYSDTLEEEPMQFDGSASDFVRAFQIHTLPLPWRGARTFL